MQQQPQPQQQHIPTHAAATHSIPCLDCTRCANYQEKLCTLCLFDTSPSRSHMSCITNPPPPTAVASVSASHSQLCTHKHKHLWKRGCHHQPNPTTTSSTSSTIPRSLDGVHHYGKQIIWEFLLVILVNNFEASRLRTHTHTHASNTGNSVCGSVCTHCCQCTQESQSYGFTRGKIP